MRILKLYAKNINALKGETSIDFEKFLEEESLFAITGQTGAGKSSLLDIIVCALYGRTPRLSNPKELMSRGTSEAICEVEFETKGRRYRSSWSIHRARRDPTGNFQAPKMEIADLSSNQIIESKASLVPKVVEDITGLDYDRFSRSMMLAQGSFDAFLKAKERDRSALLEKITDTKIYSEISKRVFELYSEKKHILEIEKRLKDEIKYLSDEEREALSSRYLEIEMGIKNIEDTIKDLEIKLNWLNIKESLENDLKEAKDQLEAIESKKELAKSEYILLDRAKRANEIKGIEDIYIIKEQRVKELKDKLDNRKKDYRLNRDKEESLKEEFERKKEELKSKTIEFEKSIDLIKEIRELNHKIDIKTHKLNDLNSRLIENKALKDGLKKRYTEIESQIDNLTVQLDSAKEYIKDNGIDADISNDIALLDEYLKQKEEITKSLEDSSSELDIKLQSRDTIRSEIDNIKKELIPLSEQKSKIDSKYSKLNSDLSSLEAKQKRLMVEVKSIEDLIKESNRRDKLNKELKRSKKELKDISKEIKDKKRIKKELKESIKDLEANIKDLEHIQKQELLIKKYEADRRHLKDGEPCPLCGSLTHPFAKKLPKLKDKTADKLEKIKRRLSKKQDRYLKVSNELSSLKSKKSSLQERILELSKEIEDIDKLLDKSNLENLEQKLDRLNSEISQIDTLKDESRELQSLRDALESKLKHYQDNLNSKVAQLDKIDSDINHLNSLIEDNQDKLKKVDKRVKEITKKYRLDSSSDDILDILKKREDKFKSNEKIVSTNSSKIEALKRDRDSLKEQIDKLDLDIFNILKNIDILNTKIETLKESKRGKLDVDDIDKFERDIKESVNNLEESYHKIRSELDRLNSINSKFELDIRDLKDELNRLEFEAQSSYNNFIEALKGSGFKDIDDYKSALLDIEEFEELNRKISQIDENLQNSLTLYNSISQRLKNHTKEMVVNRDREYIESEIIKYRDNLDNLLKESGAITEKLKADEKSQKEYKDKIERVKELEDEFEIISKLNDLIGSKDGVKFSKFAQGITLDRLIKLANRHLALFSDRYILSRRDDNKNLLDFEIIDRYQANTKRAIETLSGGESFLVSLSLALGLSELASQRVSIDSLFLDEGFGSLDEQTLDIALEALNRLQSRGKIVGVISHVNSLKEAISKQIIVRKCGGGVSKIELKG